MIHIIKGSKPQVLVENEKAWTDDLMSYVNTGKPIPESVGNKYNQPEIKDALRKECHGKCMYCESKIDVVDFPHIEHYRPKKLYRNKTFQWDNLGLSCQVCNVSKQDVFDETMPFINPYSEDPSDSFIFLGPFIWQKPGLSRAELTKNKLKLNRGALVEQRQQAIQRISDLVERYIKETNPSIKAMLENNIKKEYAPDNPYSQCVKSAVETLTNMHWK